ncbi:MAG: TetR family transcriptional regulator [Clostridiales bacterium]|jgi:hypothetical protein|nr:TetR family transcriptional regulator [Clostridiales bacterium]
MKQLTKDHILNSFNRLLREHHFEEITVKMIMEESGVSRSTFYRHYFDKYDVMNYNYKKKLDAWVKSQNCKSWLELYQRIFNATDRDRKREKNAFSYVGPNSYFTFLYDYSYAMIEQITTKSRGRPLTKDEHFQLSVFCYGGISVDIDWISGKIDYTREEIAEQIYLAMPATLRDEWCNL